MQVLLVFQRYFNLFIYVHLCCVGQLSICFMSHVNKITLTFQNSCSRSFEIFCSNSSKVKSFVINKNYPSLVINLCQKVKSSMTGSLVSPT